jgi:shikimate kinase
VAVNIVLIGLMGSGKTSVGRILAGRLGRPFVDTDDLIVQEAGMAIPAIFAREGEEGFRQRERQVIAAVAAKRNQVVATGGGAVMDAGNRLRLRQTGLVIWLQAPVAELYRRASRDGVESRPLLAGADPLQQLRDLAERRAPAYADAAHRSVETEGLAPEQVADRVTEIMQGTWEDGAGPG